MRRKRITCLLGAGAFLDIKGKSTFEITEKAEEHWKKDNISNDICELPGNFEEKFYYLEELYSEKIKEKNCENGVTTYKEKYKNINISELNKAIWGLIDTIGELVNDYDKNWDKFECNEWFKNFWEKLSSYNLLDCATLNYDSCLEKCISNYTDGYIRKVSVNGAENFKGIKVGNIAYIFDAKSLNKTHKNRIMNLHGSIRYAMASLKNDKTSIFDKGFCDLYKFATYEEAKGHWHGESVPKTQSGDYLSGGPIITGLRKPEKLMIPPYNSYNYEFQSAVQRNSSILIIGYSFGDEHINNVIKQMKVLHGKKRKIIVITHVRDEIKEKWYRGICESEMSKIDECTSGKEIECWSHFMGEEFLACVHNIFLRKKDDVDIKDFVKTIDFVESKDGNARIYICGFKKAVKSYRRDIVGFLNR